MNWLDWMLVVILVGSIFTGAARGLARESIELAATVFGVVFASRFYRQGAVLFASWIESESIRNIAGFVVVLLAFIIGGAVLSRAVSAVFRWAGIGFLDRLAGAAFGVLRAVLLAIALVMVLMAFPNRLVSQAMVESRFAPYVAEASSVLSSVTPPELKEAFARNYDDVKRAWSEVWSDQARKLPESVI